MLLGFCGGVVFPVAYFSKIIGDGVYDLGGAVVIALFLWAIIEHVRTTKQIQQASRDNRVCVYPPLYRWWGEVLLFLFFGTANLKLPPCRVHEIHLNLKTVEGLSVRELACALEADLNTQKSDCPGIYIWESHIKPPRKYRKVMREMSRSHTAYLVNRCDRKSVGSIRCFILKLLSVFQPEIRKFQKCRPIWAGVFINY